MGKLEELRRRASDINDGIYCFYSKGDFFINPLKENHIEVYVYGKDYVFSSVEEVFNTPFLNGKKIPEVLNEITWEKRI